MPKVPCLKYLYLSLLLLIPAIGQATEGEKSLVELAAQQYFELYAKRQDFQQFLDFYHPQAVLEDLVYGNRVEGRQALAEFFAWEQGNVEVLDGKAVLVVEQQIVSATKVVTKGLFNKFKYHGQVLGPWRFIIYQQFNAQGKILYQEDWINYTPKGDYTGGKNLNPK